MLNRRTLLKRLGAIVATVALAPEIAFGVKLPKSPPGTIEIFTDPATLEQLTPFWTQTSRWASCYSQAYLDHRAKIMRDFANAS